MKSSNRRLSVALFGGAGKAFFAHAHSRAIHMDGTAQITSGVLSSTPEKSLAAGDAWAYPIRAFGTIDELVMAHRDGQCPIDYACVATPNSSHYEIAEKLLREKIPVMLEKPVTVSLEQALALAKLSEQENVPVAVPHTYFGHLSLRFVRFLIQSGVLGKVRCGSADYDQGWLATLLEASGQVVQANWRTDLDIAGNAGCGGDIATHAFFHAEYATGKRVSSIKYADIRILVSGRKLDDYWHTVCELENGAPFTIAAKQVAHGKRNDSRLRIDCELGSVEWRQEDAENVYVYPLDGRTIIYSRGAIPESGDPLFGDLPEEIAKSAILPGGHVEGFLGALRFIHYNLGRHVRAWNEDPAGNPVTSDINAWGYPTLGTEGVRHMRYLEAALKSSQEGKPVAL